MMKNNISNNETLKYYNRLHTIRIAIYEICTISPLWQQQKYFLKKINFICLDSIEYRFYVDLNKHIHTNTHRHNCESFWFDGQLNRSSLSSFYFYFSFFSFFLSYNVFFSLVLTLCSQFFVLEHLHLI